MVLVNAWKTVVLERYAKFDGRAGRREYWWFVLANFLVYVGWLVVVSFGYGIAEQVGTLLVIAVGLYWLWTLVPVLAVGVRRLHDTNRIGWLMLLTLFGIVPLFGVIAAIVLLVFLATAGDRIENRYGVVDQTVLARFADILDLAGGSNGARLRPDAAAAR